MTLDELDRFRTAAPQLQALADDWHTLEGRAEAIEQAVRESASDVDRLLQLGALYADHGMTPELQDRSAQPMGDPTPWNEAVAVASRIVAAAAAGDRAAVEMAVADGYRRQPDLIKRAVIRIESSARPLRHAYMMRETFCPRLLRIAEREGVELGPDLSNWVYRSGLTSAAVDIITVLISVSLRSPLHDRITSKAFTQPIVVQPDHVPSGPVAAMQTKGIPLGEANVIVRDWLQAHREESMAITRDRIAKETGVSAGQVSKCPAWSAFKCAREKMQKREGGEVQLSSRMEAVVPSNCPMPDELAALIEEQEADEAKDARHGYRHNRRHGPS